MVEERTPDHPARVAAIAPGWLAGRQAEAERHAGLTMARNFMAIVSATREG